MDVEAFGDKKAMEAHEIGLTKFLKKNDNINSILGKDDGIMYLTKKTKHKAGKFLDAYVFDSYLLYSDQDDNGKMFTDKTTEIEFVSTKILTITEFFGNLMEAQAFSGFHDKRYAKYRFIGMGDFNMYDYIEAHPLAAQSNMHLLDFFLFHKKVLSSIGFFIAGLCENDINSQREYLTEQEYKDIMSESKRQWNAVKKFNNKLK
jgi:hypothetical protein